MQNAPHSILHHFLTLDKYIFNASKRFIMKSSDLSKQISYEICFGFCRHQNMLKASCARLSVARIAFKFVNEKVQIIIFLNSK